MLGRTASGTLKLSVDDTGLIYETELPNTTLGNDVYEMVNRGDFYESSFMFTVNDAKQRWEYNEEEDIWYRYIEEIETLYDCTVCSYRGAYSKTDVEVAERSLKEFIKETSKDKEKEVEEEQKRKEQLQHQIKLLRLKNKQLLIK